MLTLIEVVMRKGLIVLGVLATFPIGPAMAEEPTVFDCIGAAVAAQFQYNGVWQAPFSKEECVAAAKAAHEAEAAAEAKAKDEGMGRAAEEVGRAAKEEQMRRAAKKDFDDKVAAAVAKIDAEARRQAQELADCLARKGPAGCFPGKEQ